MHQAYKERVTRELYEKIWEFQNMVNSEGQDADEALGEVIYRATKYPSIVTGRISDLVEQSKEDKI